MTARAQVQALVPVVKLRERRVEKAMREAAEARRKVADAVEALEVRDRLIAAHDVARARLDDWFAGGLSGAAHLVASALARREAVALAREADQRLRDQEAVALDLAREDLAAAIQALARAQGRFDAMSGRLDHARALVAADREAREQLELEDAGAFRSFR
ncbi:hypothetical protein [Caulobacter endophyticus]|uniref:Uncharacterized protein n=1 Tax=Caulobacter endophyticus TaxID=2172652 RepID=A0A2T9JX02_9CAUL|nr:hypothetical protein [Caulobacter endophyticus]PVM88245.1 hypothetical protein DDF67_13460 [Caulobacter endophyticus]